MLILRDSCIVVKVTLEFVCRDTLLTLKLGFRFTTQWLRKQTFVLQGTRLLSLIMDSAFYRLYNFWPVTEVTL